jgi:hypothetical protein
MNLSKKLSLASSGFDYFSVRTWIFVGFELEYLLHCPPGYEPGALPLRHEAFIAQNDD